MTSSSPPPAPHPGPQPAPKLNYDAAERAAARSRADGPWSMEHLRLCWQVLVAATVLATIPIAIFAGWQAGLGAAVGFTIVGLFFTLSTVAVAKIGELLPEFVMVAALAAYAIKIAALGIVIIAMPADGPVSQRWMAICVVIGLVTWMAAHLRYVWTAKVYYTDPEAGSGE